MATFTKIWNVSRTGSQIFADLEALGWNSGLVYLEIGPESADGPAGAGPKNGGGGAGIAAWGTIAGFVSDGVDITSAVDCAIIFTANTAVSFMDGAGRTYGVLSGKTDGTAGDDGSSFSDVAPTVGFVGGAGGAAGVGGGGGGGGAATLDGPGTNGTAGGAVNGGIAGNDGSGNDGGGNGGNTAQAGHNALANGGGGGQGLGSSTPGLAATIRAGATTEGGYVKIIGTIVQVHSSGLKSGLERGLVSGYVLP